MLLGKIIAWNNENQRGIIEDRMGRTWKFEAKDLICDRWNGLVNTEVAFEGVEEQRECYAVEPCIYQFRRFEAYLKAKPIENKKVLA